MTTTHENQAQAISPAEARAIAKEASIYGFPMVDSYGPGPFAGVFD